MVDDLKGLPEAIEAVFPRTMTQTCIVHLIRNSLEAVSWKDRKALMPSLQAIYQAATAEAAEAALAAFEAGPWARLTKGSVEQRSVEWSDEGKRYPMIAPCGAGPGGMWCRSSPSRRRSGR